MSRFKINKLTIILILLLVASLTGYMYFLDKYDIINFRQIIFPYFVNTPVLGEYIESKYSNITNKEIILREIQKERLAIQDKQKKLEEKEINLQKENEKLEKLRQELIIKEKEINSLEKQYNDKIKKYNDVQRNIRELADLFASMKPEDAVERLKKFNDILIIDIFRQMIEDGNKRIVIRVISLMDIERSSQILRKMEKKRIELK